MCKPLIVQFFMPFIVKIISHAAIHRKQQRFVSGKMTATKDYCTITLHKSRSEKKKKKRMTEDKSTSASILLPVHQT